MGVTPGAEIGVFDLESYAAVPRLTTSVGYGASKIVEEGDRPPRFRAYRENPNAGTTSD
jgi:hypothetical protein